MAKGKKKRIIAAVDVGFGSPVAVPQKRESKEEKVKEKEKSSIVNIELTESGKLPADILAR